MPISWKDEMSVGIEEIDVQHRVIIKMVNELEDCIANKNLDSVKAVLTDAVNYVSSHFTVEETLMSLFNYTDFTEHRLQHQKFAEEVVKKKRRIETFYDVKGEFAEKLALEIAEELSDMLQKWLVNHIMKTDKDYSSFFLKVKEKAAHKGGWLSWFGIS